VFQHPIDITLLRSWGIILFAARTRLAAKSKETSIPCAKPGSGVLLQPTDMKRFDLDILFYPELGSFTPQSRLLYTAERRNLG
jgi:hypothetical protein